MGARALVLGMEWTRAKWRALVFGLVAVGVILMGYETVESSGLLRPSRTSVNAVDSGAIDVSKPLSSRLQVIKETIELLNAKERIALATHLRESGATLVALPAKSGGQQGGASTASQSPSVPPKKTKLTPLKPPPSPTRPTNKPPVVAPGGQSSGSSAAVKGSGEAPSSRGSETAPSAADGEGVTLSSKNPRDPLQFPNGLQGNSVIIVKGIYSGACFAVELQDEAGVDIQYHINFRPSARAVYASHYKGGWGAEFVSKTWSFTEGQPFVLRMSIRAPPDPMQPWTVTSTVNDAQVFKDLLIPDFHKLRRVIVHEKCGEGRHNEYSLVEATGLPDTPWVRPSLSFDRPVTPSGPTKDTIMLLGILSAPKNKELRGAQRRAWLNHEFCTSGRGLVRFFVGKSGDDKIDKMVEEENAQTGDIMILKNHKESYYSIAGKTAAMVHYAVEIGAKFLLKCDDDTYVDIPQVMSGIEGKGGGLVLAAITYNGGAFRSGKWAMPVEDWPKPTYPPFPHGPGYVIGQDILKYADKKLKEGTLRPLALEDVSMGVWIDHASKHGGVSVNYQSRKGKSRGGVNIGGCHPGAMISHYQLPEQMICMWSKQLKGMSNLCC